MLASACYLLSLILLTAVISGFNYFQTYVKISSCTKQTVQQIRCFTFFIFWKELYFTYKSGGGYIIIFVSLCLCDCGKQVMMFYHLMLLNKQAWEKNNFHRLHEQFSKQILMHWKKWQFLSKHWTLALLPSSKYLHTKTKLWQLTNSEGCLYV